MKKKFKTIIPKSEKELIGTREGDLVKISFQGVNNLESIWTMYKKLEKGRDYFIYQEPAKNKGDKHLVAIRSSRRDTHQYDRNFGVILNHLYEDLEFVGHLRKKEECNKHIQGLNKSNLWRE